MTDRSTVDDWLCIADVHEYGAQYRDHALAQYSLYVEMTERIGLRRSSANTFFLAVNAAVISAISLIPHQTASLVAVGLAGVCLCLTWWLLVRSYRQLAAGKFQIINAIEKLLAIAPYTAERRLLREGRDIRVFLPLTHVEHWVPLMFGTIYLAITALGVYRWAG